MSIVAQVRAQIDALLHAGLTRTTTRFEQGTRLRRLHADLLEYIRTVPVEDLYALSPADRDSIARNLLLNEYTSMFNKLAACTVDLSAVTRNEINRHLRDWCSLLDGCDAET